MNEVQIDYFMAVATNLSFTKTSEELYVSQPAISKQISGLEKELGVKLFRRNNKKTELTEAGKLFYDLFKNYKADFIKTKKMAALLDMKQEQIIKIGFMEGWDLYEYVPQIISRFNEKHPEVKVIINCCGIKELSTLILTGGLDVALTFENSVQDIHEIEQINLLRLKKRLIYSKRKFTEESYKPEDFAKETFFAPYSVVNKLVSRTVHNYMVQYGFDPKIEFVPNHESMITCVRNGMGVAITDEWVWANGAEDLATIPVDADDMISIILMKGNKDEETRDMAEIIRSVYSDN